MTKTNEYADLLKQLLELQAEANEHIDAEKPYTVGNTGHVEFSSVTDLARSPEWIADVNGYYRGLGVSPRADRKELGRAYLRMNGQQSEWLTYVMSQLLNPSIRRDYDRTPIGSIYVDKYVREELNRMVHQAQRDIALLRKARGISDEEHERIEEQVNAAFEKRLAYEDQQDDIPELDVSAFPYDYYLWKSEEDDGVRLQQWQANIITALKGYRTKLSVGYCGEIPQPWAVSMVGRRTVVFLNEAALPTPQNATAAAQFIIQQKHRRHK